jgi:hypothetical protein
MESNRAKALVAIGSIALIAVLFVVLSGGEEESTPTSAGTTATAPAPEAENQEGTGGEDSGGEGSAPGEKPEGEAGGTEVPAIVVTGGEPEGGVAELEFEKDSDVRFTVESDVAEEIHVHGYDIYADLEPGKPAEVAFRAEIEGVFEVELHGTSVPIAELTVPP